MTPNEIADTLAWLAGWERRTLFLPAGSSKASPSYSWTRGDTEVVIHPFPPGALDPLLRLVEERLPAFRWISVDWTKYGVRASGFSIVTRHIASDRVPTEWEARSLAVIAAFGAGKNTP